MRLEAGNATREQLERGSFPDELAAFAIEELLSSVSSGTATNFGSP